MSHPIPGGGGSGYKIALGEITTFSPYELPLEKKAYYYNRKTFCHEAIHNGKTEAEWIIVLELKKG